MTLPLRKLGDRLRCLKLVLLAVVELCAQRPLRANASMRGASQSATPEAPPQQDPEIAHSWQPAISAAKAEEGPAQQDRKFRGAPTHSRRKLSGMRCAARASPDRNPSHRSALAVAEPGPLQSQALGVSVRSRPPFPAETCRHRNLPIPTPSPGPVHRFTAPLVPASWVTLLTFLQIRFAKITPLVQC